MHAYIYAYMYLHKSLNTNVNTNIHDYVNVYLWRMNKSGIVKIWWFPRGFQSLSRRIIADLVSSGVSRFINPPMAYFGSDRMAILAGRPNTAMIHFLYQTVTSPGRCIEALSIHLSSPSQFDDL